MASHLSHHANTGQTLEMAGAGNPPKDRRMGGYPGDPRGRKAKPPVGAPPRPSKSFGGPSYGNQATISTGELKFPSNLGTDPTQMNMMMFTIKEITGGKADARSLQFKTSDKAPVICLPIPTGVNTSNQQGWSRAEVKPWNAHMVGSDTGQDVVTGMANVMRTAGADFMTPEIEHGAKPSVGQAIQNMLKDVAGNFGPEDPGSSASWGSYFSGIGASANKTFGGMITEGAAMMAANPLSGIAEAAQYTAGLRAVNQAIMSYSGPGFRSFNYSFSFKPFSPMESLVVHKIVDTFKIYSAPDQLEATDYTRVYNLPAVFKIQFYNGSEEHSEIGHVGHCALTNITVTYGGSKFSTFADTHSPTQVDVTLAFQEMELLNRQMVMIEEFGGGNWPNPEGKGQHGQQMIGNAGGGWT